MPDPPDSARLTPDRWRRIGVVLDRVHDASPELRDAALQEACREEALSVEDVHPFLEAGQHAGALPECVPPELLADALADLPDQAADDFRLTAGQTLGPYEIVSTLGAGGMGEVYRARDTRLDRTVAVKVVRPHLLQSAPARQQFDQEARAISSLNHPHVCTLHDVGHQDGVDFLVMEFVDGETLATRLRRGALTTVQALRYGAQVADALDRAHRQGIVHRDLKPANIMVTRAGVKLLDFGLAHLEASAAPDAHAGLMGTPQYMAPEQLAGSHADARSDIFACGAVLYEMLTGRRAFAGASQSEVVSAIREHDPPPVSPVIGGAPGALDWTLARCLAKDPDDRWQSAADLKHHLEWLAAGTEQPRQAARPRRTGLAAGVLLALVAVALAVWTWLQGASPPAPAAPVVFAIDPPAGATFELTHAVSPDGRRIAFTAARDGTNALWVRSLDSLTAQHIAGTEGAAFPFWSPDGRFIAFFAARTLRRVDLASGAIHVICDTAGGGGGTWNADDVIVFAPGSGVATGLWRVQASGGIATPITAPVEGLDIHGWPQFLPDGRRFLYMRAGTANQGVYVGDLDPAVAHRPVLVPAPSGPTSARLAGDVLFFLDESTLMAQRFDVDRLVPVEERVRVADSVHAREAPGLAAFDVSPQGVVAYREPAAARPTQLTWLDRRGQAMTPLGEAAPYMSVAISRDGRATLNWWQQQGGSSGVVNRIDLGTGATTPLFTSVASPVWSPDGSRVVFTRFGESQGPTPMVASLDGRRPERTLADFGAQAYATDWSRDGRFIVGSSLHPGTSADIWIADPDGVAPLRYLVREPRSQIEARISPDGRWFAYSAMDEQGALDVYVRSFPDGGSVQRVSVREGRSPRWRADGRELYYVEPGGRLMRVPVSGGATFSPGAPELLFEHAGLVAEPHARFAGYAYDVSPDGTRFLLAIPSPGAVALSPIVVRLDWTMPTRR